MSKSFYVIDYAEYDGPFNMGLDVALLVSPPDRPVLRFYGWQPHTISLGRFQTLDDTLRQSLAPYAMTRRTTGGGAIYHGDELTYSIVGSLSALNLTHDRAALYTRMHEAWISAFESFADLEPGALTIAGEQHATSGAASEGFFCFTRRSAYDVVALSDRFPTFETDHSLHNVVEAQHPGTQPTRKLIGSAQRHRKGVVLQHGSIKIGPAPVAPWALSLAEICNDPELDAARVAQACNESVAQALGIELRHYTPTPTILDDARRIADELFAAHAWLHDAQRTQAKETKLCR